MSGGFTNVQAALYDPFTLHGTYTLLYSPYYRGMHSKTDYRCHRRQMSQRASSQYLRAKVQTSKDLILESCSMCASKQCHSSKDQENVKGREMLVKILASFFHLVSFSLACAAGQVIQSETTHRSWPSLVQV